MNELNKETEILKRTIQFHTVSLCLYVADPATFLASNSVLGTLFSSENSLFIQSYKLNSEFVLLPHQCCKTLKFRVWIISSAKLHSAPLKVQMQHEVNGYEWPWEVQHSVHPHTHPPLLWWWTSIAQPVAVNFIIVLRVGDSNTKRGQKTQT